MNDGSGQKKDPNAKDQVPLNAKPIVPESSTIRYRHMRGSHMLTVDPAACDLTALATRQFGEVSLKNKTGSARPPFVLPGFDQNFEYLYLIPLAEAVPGAVPVSFRSGRHHFNLYVAFQHANRLAPAGRREIYPLKPTSGEVTIGDVKGWGLVCKLSEVTSEPLGTLSPEDKAKRKAARERNLKNKLGGTDTAATGD